MVVGIRTREPMDQTILVQAVSRVVQEERQAVAPVVTVEVLPLSGVPEAIPPKQEKGPVVVVVVVEGIGAVLAVTVVVPMA